MKTEEGRPPCAIRGEDLKEDSYKNCTQKTTVIFCWSTKPTSFPTEQPQVMSANLSRVCFLTWWHCCHTDAQIVRTRSVCTFRRNDYFRKLVLASTSNCSSQKAKNCQELEASTGHREPVSTIKSTLEMFQVSLKQLNWISSINFLLYIFLIIKLQKPLGVCDLCIQPHVSSTYKHKHRGSCKPPIKETLPIMGWQNEDSLTPRWLMYPF